MTNIITASSDTINFKVNAQTGEAFISVRKTAELIAVPDTSLRRYLDSPDGAPNFDRKQGLTAEILQKVTHYFCTKGNQKAIELLSKLAEAGAKAFIYHEAGVPLKPDFNSVPLSYKESLLRLYEMECEKENLLEDLAAKALLIGSQQTVIDHKNIKTDCSDTHFTIKRVRVLNQGMKIDPKILLRVCETLGNGVETVYDHYDQTINQYSREVWEEAYPDAILPE